LKRKLSAGLFCIGLVGSASAQGLYYVGSEAQESLPLKWVVGASAFYDDNINAGNSGPQAGSFGLNPYVGLSFVNITPQTTWDVYARLGLIYYADAAPGVATTNSQSRAGVNLTHRFSERLRFSSRNFIAYELNPDYSSGIANSATTGEYLNWSSDNSVGFRWTERLGTYTGLTLNGNSYADSSNNDLFTSTLYNQLRYQLGPQTVLTQDYRYAINNASGLADDSTDQYILVGLEQRFSPHTIGIIRGGVQLHSVDGGGSTSTGGGSYTSPYLELAFNSQLSQQFSVRAFARYGIESNDTVQFDSSTGQTAVYNDTQSLRLGVSSEYTISPMFSVFAGVDYIPTSYADGQSISAPFQDASDLNSNLISLNIGLTAKFNDYLTGTLSYDFQDSISDIDNQDYTRNRVSLGVSAEF
jgi:hypothetical protein